MKNSTEMKYYIWVDEPDTIIFSVKTLWKKNRILWSMWRLWHKNKYKKSTYTQWGQVWDVITQYSGRPGRDGEEEWWWHKGKGQWQVISFLFLLSFKETASTNGLEEPQHHHRAHPHWAVRRPPHPALLFALFLVIYLLTVMGNLTMLLLIKADSHLHMPMYFFLSNLSFLDLCFSSVTVPKLLKDLLSERKTISIEGCLAQVFFVFIAPGTEVCLLSAMAYDRYAAVCHQLLYSQVMSNQLCVRLVLISLGLISLISWCSHHCAFGC